MPLKDLKCDLIVKASGLTGQSPFFFKGDYQTGNTYYSNWTVRDTDDNNNLDRAYVSLDNIHSLFLIYPNV